MIELGGCSGGLDASGPDRAKHGYGEAFIARLRSINCRPPLLLHAGGTPVDLKGGPRSPCSMTSTASMAPGYPLSQVSSMPEVPSPTTTASPSVRGHSRLPGSASSLPSSPIMRESDGFSSTKRPLTDVKEDPLEREEDHEMTNTSPEPIASYGELQKRCAGEINPLRSVQTFDGVGADATVAGSPSKEMSGPEWTFDDPNDLRFLEYDLADDSDLPQNPVVKKQRADGSPLDGIAAKISAIKPSISRRWRSRRASPSVVLPGGSREPSLSRANSTRAPSFTSATNENKRFSYQMPPTPTRSILDEGFEDGRFHESAKKAAEQREELDEWQDQAKPTTPLLPPLLTSVIPDHIKEVPYQSPLQSPSVADPDTFSPYQSPLTSPHVASLPSPPLSARPSVASFNRRPSIRGLPTPTCNPTHHHVPSTEIPPNPLDAPQDDWADTLGHANFHISPEPYCPAHPSAAACERLRQDWQSARNTFTAHLEHVAEHYGPTSKIYILTEEKWAGIDAIWKRNVEACTAAGAISGGDGSDFSYFDDATLQAENRMDFEGSPDNTSLRHDSIGTNTGTPLEHSLHALPSPLATVSKSGEIHISTVSMSASKTPTPVIIPVSGGPYSPASILNSPAIASPFPKRSAKFPTPGENGIVGPMEVVASRNVLEAQLDRSEAAGRDLYLPSNSRGSSGSPDRRKRKWGAVFNLRWMWRGMAESGAK